MTLNDQAGVLDRILANRELHSLFQPIVSLSERRILGYEALIRGASNTPLHSPLPLYATARQAGRPHGRRRRPDDAIAPVGA